MQLIYGIIGLGLVVLIHEAGHFFAARAVGIRVEVFSIGWGRKLFGFRRNDTEYRISWIPLGGFVKMKGETAYQSAVEEGKDLIDAEPDSYFGAAPWRRIIVALAGPAMNLIFALIVLSLINLGGYEYRSFSNRIVLSDDFPEYSAIEGQSSPALRAGLSSGDRILAVDQTTTENFQILSQELSTRALDEVQLTVLRNGEQITRTAELLLDPESGAGILGIYPYIEPIVGGLAEGSTGNLRIGDRILSINGTEVGNSYEVRRALDGIAVGAEQVNADLVIERDGMARELVHPLMYDSERNMLLLGFYYQQGTYRVASDGIFDALASGWNEVWETLAMTFKGLGLMFRGLNPMNALSGPIKITMMVGEITAEGLSQGISTGIRAFFHLLSLLSVALFFGNLLPIPVLDGGQVIISLAEIIKRSPIGTKAFFRYQSIGAVIVFALIAFILFGDLLFIFTR